VPQLRVLFGKETCKITTYDEPAEDEMLVSRERDIGYLATRYIGQRWRAACDESEQADLEPERCFGRLCVRIRPLSVEEGVWDA